MIYLDHSATTKVLPQAAEAACVPTQSTRNLRESITPEEVYQAMQKADALGRSGL